MNYGQIRFIKRILLALFLVSGVYVGREVWEGLRSREATASVSIEETEAAVSRQIEIEQLDSEGRTAWTLKAAESTGRTETSQRFRDVEIRFEAGKDKVPVVVTAEQCEVQNDSSVFLQGNVVVKDDTSLRLEAETLHFRRQPDRVWSDDPVRYFRDDLSGDAGRMHYLLDAGALDLGEGVAMTLQERSAAPVRIESRNARMRRKIRLVRFVDRVRVRQANRALDSNDLQVYLTEERDEIERMEAYEKVDFRLDVDENEKDASAGAGATEGLASEPGSKRLLTDRLEVFLRPGGEHLERARAVEGGRLVMTLPESASSGYHKELEGYTLAFDFDEEGRLQVLRGRGGITLVLTPAAEGEQKKTITARQLEAEFDPESGDLRVARCERAVTFEQGSVRATSELGTFLSPESLLVLVQEPRLWDEQARLEAKEIRIGVDSGDVEGKGDVRSTSTNSVGSNGEQPGMGLFPGGGSEPVYFVSEALRFDRAADRAVYTGGARGIQGENRIHAERIEIQQGKGELLAEGDVRTILHQSTGGGREGEPVLPTVTDAERLVYRSPDNELRYEGKVSMRGKDMTLRGRSVDVRMSSDAKSEVEEIVADGEVSIDTVAGKASGDNARYLPKEDTMTVSGDVASLENAGKLTEGKQLTIFLADGKILVDGREQTRTKTTYSSKPRL